MILIDVSCGKVTDMDKMGEILWDEISNNRPIVCFFGGLWQKSAKPGGIALDIYFIQN